MMTSRQLEILMKTINKGQSLTQAAARTGISRTTARRYRDEPTRLSEPKSPRSSW